MLRFLSSAASAGEMFSAVNVDARTEAKLGRARAGRGEPLNINLALTNTLSKSLENLTLTAECHKHFLSVSASASFSPGETIVKIHSSRIIYLLGKTQNSLEN